MLRRIVLENFMSHGRTEIELAEGLTVLTGPNNCGKSAVVAALQVLATNGRTTHVMRHGCKSCSITVETDDGHTIQWQRTKTSAKYIIDGEPIHRVGQAVPERLHDILRLDCVQAEAGKSTYDYDIHFGEQKAPIFLLGETGSRAASFFASSSDAARLVEMQHLHRSRLREKKSEAKHLIKQVEQIDETLLRFAGVDDLDANLQTAEQCYEELLKLADRIGQARELRSDLRRLQHWADVRRQQLELLSRLARATTDPNQLRQSSEQIDRLRLHIRRQEQWKEQTLFLRLVHKLLSALKSPPDQHDVPKITGRIERLVSVHSLKNHALRLNKTCRDLVSPPELHPTPPLRRMVTKIETAIRGCVVRQDELHRLKTLAIPPTVRDPAKLAEHLKRLLRTRRHAEMIERVHRRLIRLQPPPPTKDSQALEQLIQRFSRLSAEATRAQDTLDVATRDLSRCEMGIRRFVEQHPRCSVCGSRVDPDQLISTAPDGRCHVTKGGAS